MPSLGSSPQGSPSHQRAMGPQPLVGAEANQGGGNQGDQFSHMRPRLLEIMREFEPRLQLDEDVKEALLLLADDFIDSAVNAACLMSRLQHAPNVELRDSHPFFDNGLYGFQNVVVMDDGRLHVQQLRNRVGDEFVMSEKKSKSTSL